jgi:hypothetical protein
MAQNFHIMGKNMSFETRFDPRTSPDKVQSVTATPVYSLPDVHATYGSYMRH